MTSDCPVCRKPNGANSVQSEQCTWHGGCLELFKRARTIIRTGAKASGRKRIAQFVSFALAGMRRQHRARREQPIQRMRIRPGRIYTVAAA